VVKKSNLEDAEYGLFAKQFIPANALFCKILWCGDLREEGYATSPPGVALLKSCLL
jgi:hypothetical protein